MEEEVNKPTSNTRAGGHVSGGGISWGRKSVCSSYEISGRVEKGRGDRKVYIAKVAVSTWNSVECGGRSCARVAYGVVRTRGE